MTRPALAAALIVCASASAAAQQPVTIDDLTAPASPAFVLLDAAPAAVERPETAKAFTVSLLNRLTSARGTLPDHYALEITPYWLASHPNLTFGQYQSPAPGQSVLQSLAISVGSVPLPAAPAAADPAGTRLGLGFRTNVWNGRPNPRLAARVEELAGVNGRILDALRLQAEARNLPRTSAAETQKADEAMQKALESEQAARAEARTLAAEIEAMDAERIGFFLSVAAGQTWAFPSDDVRQGRAEKGGVWVTPAYRVRACNTENDACDARIDVIGVVRGLIEEGRDDNRWEYGGRLVWRPIRELYLSLEAVRRQAGGATTTMPAVEGSARTVGMLEYRVRPDLVLYGSFGRDFQRDTGVKPLVSLLGLNLGLGRRPVLLADTR